MVTEHCWTVGVILFYCSVSTHPFSSALSDATEVEKLKSAFVSLFCKQGSECGLDLDS